MNLRITTFNLFQYCNFNHSYYTKKEKYKKEEWEIKNQWIKDRLTEINSDIVGFQEVFSHEDLEKLTKESGFKYFAKIDTAKKEKKTYKTCIVTLASKYPIVKIETIEKNKNIIDMFDFDEDFNFQRKPLKVTISIKDKEYIIYVLHLKSNRLNEIEHLHKKRTSINNKLKKSIKSFNLKEANALQQRLCEAFHIASDIYNENRENIIVVGDFNDKEFSLCNDILCNKTLIESIDNFKQFEKINLTKSEYQLFDSFYKSKNFKKRPFTSYFINFGNVLDYIFVSKNLINNFKSYHFYDAHLKNNIEGSLLNSDHAIITSNFKL